MLKKLKSFLLNEKTVATKDSFFVPENALLDRRKIHKSNSGLYTLEITPFKTDPGAWNFTQGIVKNKGGRVIAEIRRNYSSFPFLFVEDHPNGHHYLVCGEDYQGQTVIELDTGSRRDFRPDAAKMGHGFCWADYHFMASSQFLVVSGCYWGAAYEYKFYDFSDPIYQGWKEIDCVDRVLDDEKKFSINADGSLTFYRTRDPHEDDLDYDEETSTEELIVVASVTIKRVADNIEKISEWISDEEKQRLARIEESIKRRDEMWRKFRSTDLLYLLSKDLRKHKKFDSYDGYERIGFTGKDWCPHWSGEENIVYLNLKDAVGHSVTLGWAVTSGPIQVEVIKKNFWLKERVKTVEWFEHSTDGMVKAFDFAKKNS